MTWKPQRDPKVIGDASIQYLRSDQTHGHEGAHDVTLGGLTVRVLPDGHTTARKRYDTILEAVTTAQAVTRWKVDLHFDPVAYLVGYLMTAGLTSIEIEGEPVFARPEAKGQWLLELRDDGTTEAKWMGER